MTRSINLDRKTTHRSMCLLLYERSPSSDWPPIEQITADAGKITRSNLNSNNYRCIIRNSHQPTLTKSFRCESSFPLHYLDTRIVGERGVVVNYDESALSRTHNKGDYTKSINAHPPIPWVLHTTCTCNVIHGGGCSTLHY